MQRLASHLRARPRLYAALALGALAAWLLPASVRPATRGLIGWNVAIWLYLAAMLVLMQRADHERLRHVAALHSEGAAAILVGVVCAVAASVIAIVGELAEAHAAGQAHHWQHVVLALTTLIGSWLLLPTLFALSYASVYFEADRGLDFPGDEGPPDYLDFMYYAVTIAATAQTADVAITTRSMRRWTLAQQLVSFAFNTALLALAINIAAGLL